MAKRRKNKNSDYIGRSKGESLASMIFRDQNPLDNLTPVEELPEMSQGSVDANSSSSATSSTGQGENSKSKKADK